MARLVYAVPNHAEVAQLSNRKQVNGSVVFVDRGKIEMVHKVLTLQSAGAVAVLIADDGTCDASFTSCGHRGGNRYEGFAPHDPSDLWMRVGSLPVFLVSVQTSETLRRMMRVSLVDMPYLGLQNVTADNKPNRDEL
jgi:hypothetical protein